MGFLKKIFRRKGGKSEQVQSHNSSSKKEKRNRSSRKGSDGKVKKNESNNSKLQENSNIHNSNEETIERSPSFTGTTGTRASSSLSRGEQGVGNDYSSRTTSSKQQKPETRVLSPRNGSNKIPNGTGKPTRNGTPKKEKWNGPIDLDEDIGDETDQENNDMVNIQSLSAGLPGGLSYQQLQQFNKQQQQQQQNPQQQQSSHNPHRLYDMSPENVVSRKTPGGTKQSSDSSNCSSDFNLSTDAEDTEYNNLKRRGVMPSANAPASVNISSGALDTSGLSSAMSIEDDDTNVFPELKKDNRISTTSSPVPVVISKKQVAPVVVDDEPEPNVDFADEDMRAWDPSHTSSSKENFSPSNNAKTKTAPMNDGFANFADFDTATFQQSEFQSPNTTSGTSNNGTKKKKPPRTTYHFEDFSGNNDFVGVTSGSKSHHRVSSSSSAANPESPLSDILAKAKEKRSSRSQRHKASSSSVNSAPVITPAFLREQHNLKSSRSMKSNDKNNNNNSASVSDIIENLEATNAARMMNSTSRRSSSSRNGDSVSGSVRSAKDRLRAKRRKERKERSQSRSGDSDDDSDNENFLFQEVAGALGPRGAGADMESLSGRSKSSTGNKSNRSHRSHRSHRSSTRRRKKTSSGESVSVGSKGSRGSRHSRSSRYSHRSTRSYLSHMSEQSRSVANDLLRLEMQLAMVGSQDASARGSSMGRSGGSIAGGSIGGASRTSRSSRASARRSSRISNRTKVNIVAPAGKLGIILANKADSKGTVVSGVRTSSVLVDKISPGDRIIAIDGEDVSRMTVSEITTIMARKADFERTLAVLTTPKQKTPSKSSGGSIAAKSPSRSSNSAYNSGTTDGSVGNASYNNYRSR